MLHRIFTLLILGFPGWISAQFVISGVVVDPSGEPLPFVHILVNNQKDRVFTAELSGAFSIPRTEDMKTLTFSFVGFASKELDVTVITGKPLRVVLEPIPFNLSEAVVVAGENPAHRIIRKAVENRDAHNPEKLKGYQYRAFTKLILKMLPDAKMLAEIREDTAGGDFPFDSLHLFIMETLSKHAFEKPQRVREEILRHRTSGFQQPWFTGIVSQLQPFSFYRDEIPFLEKRYLNPVSPGSTSRYRFRLEETYLDGPDSIFVISFQPFDNKAFVGLKGMLHIHSDGYAIQHLVTESAEEEKIAFHMDQKYRKTASGNWFPAQLSLVLDAAKYPSPDMGMRVSSRTYLDSVEINPTFPKGYFALPKASTTAPDINLRDGVLELERKEQLSPIDSMSFALLDSLGAEANLDKGMNFLQSLAGGGLQIGKMEWVYTDLIRFSDFEGFVPGIGLRTSTNLSKTFQLYTYGGYAVRPKTWQYKAQVKIFPKPEFQKNHFGLSISRGLVEPATFDNPDGVLNPFNRRFFAQRMELQQQYSAFAAFQISRSLSLRAAVNRMSQEPLYDYTYIQPLTGEPQSSFDFAETELWLRYAWKVRTFRMLGFESEIQSDRPVITLRVTKGWNGILGADYDYWRLHSLMQYTLRSHRLGATSMAFEAGWATGDVPFSRLFTAVGTGAGWNTLSLNNAFETMQPYEFAADRNLHVYMQHEFGRLTRKSDWFQPQPVLIHRMGWGGLTQPDAHVPILVAAMNRGYWESGMAINSLLRFNYVNIGWLSAGIKVLYRYGPYRLDRLEDNFAYRLTLQVSR
jgi:hypothetical protein